MVVERAASWPAHHLYRSPGEHMQQAVDLLATLTKLARIQQDINQATPQGSSVKDKAIQELSDEAIQVYTDEAIQEETEAFDAIQEECEDIEESTELDPAPEDCAEVVSSVEDCEVVHSWVDLEKPAVSSSCPSGYSSDHAAVSSESSSVSSSEGAVSSDEDIVLGYNYVECGVCGVRYVEMEYLVQHVAAHTMEFTELEECDYCGQFCSSVYNSRFS